MALPQLNSSPQYTTKIPSTGLEISYRPYLVKEEKVLMIAFETGDQKQALRAIVDTMNACITDDIDITKLTTFDVEYLFTQIRSKSVGEVATVLLSCSSCEHKNEVDVDLSTIEVVNGDKSNIIQLTDDISVEMQYPSYKSIMNLDMEKQNTELGFEMLINCVGAICTEEERIDTRDIKRQDVQDFIEQMTTEQFKRVSDFMSDMPVVKKDITFPCVSCNETNNHTLQGINDFLS